MAAFCPSLGDPDVKTDFAYIKDIAGENGAYFLWDKYEGDMKKILDHLSKVMEKLVL